MGVYQRPDSPFWWLWLESAPPGHQRVKTDIPIGNTPNGKKHSRAAAEAVYHEQMVALGRGQGQKPAVLFDRYAAHYERHVISHHKGAEREREIAAKLRAAFGHLPLHEITRETVRAWMTARREKASASTVNREVDLLKAMLRDAVPQYLDASPLRGMARLKGVTPRRRVLTPDEEARLLKACEDAQDTALLVLGIDTLQRMGDLLDLRRTDRKGNWIYIADTKNSEAIEIPLSPRAAKALDAIKGASAYYFSKFRKAENPRDWRGSVRQRLEYLCKQADVPFGKANQGITFHWATRRTGTTRLIVDRQIPVAVVQRLGNWRRPDVPLTIYTEAQRDDLARAVGQSDSRHTHGARKRAKSGRKTA